MLQLRSRSKAGGTRERVSRPLPRYHQDDPFRHLTARHPRDAVTRRASTWRVVLSLSRVLQSLLFLAISLYALSMYIRHANRAGRGVLDPDSNSNSSGSTTGSTGFAPYLGKEENTGRRQDDQTAPWKFPLVDRTVLDKLERMRKFFAPGYYDLLGPPRVSRGAPPLARGRWPPIVRRIPEAPQRERAESPEVVQHHRDMAAETALCGSTAHPRACRFLLPLRIAEQESKARIHLMQMARLARELNRTLVLPHVGKSKIGACFRWELGAYYDVASLGAAAGLGARSGELVAEETEDQDDSEWFIELEDFHSYLVDRASHHISEKNAISSQLISIGPSLPVSTPFRIEPVYFNDDVSVYGYGEYGVWERDLPGCFASKFQLRGGLELETRPVFMAVSGQVGGKEKDGSIKLVGASVVEAFRAVSDPGSVVDFAPGSAAGTDSESITGSALVAGVDVEASLDDHPGAGVLVPFADDTQAPVGLADFSTGDSVADQVVTPAWLSGIDASASSPEVLVVSWDLRQPIFADPPASSSRAGRNVARLQYSPYMHEIAARYAPISASSSQYLAVQWRMETVDLNILDACAHSLVDLLTQIMHDSAMSENITTVWFASDYPRPVAKGRRPHHRAGPVTKSGTFRDFDVRHEEAIDILRAAFEDGGDLSAWKLTDLVEAADEDGEEDDDFLKDSGTLGIVDKIISIDANVFVSGSSRCSRRSSFTKQVVEGRRERMMQGRTEGLQNIVDVFG